MRLDAAPGLRDVPATRRSTGATLRAIRPLQWSKNLVVFAGILFAAKLGDPARWIEAVACFAAYCAASSASYLLNDVRDRESDQAHPLKRGRPIASGELSPRAALWLATALTATALAVTLTVGAASVGVMAAFLVLQAAYTGSLKHVVLLDVLSIAGLFVIRAAAGAVAVDVRISPWLLLCTGLLALFLALGKRRGELLLVRERTAPGRRVLTGYSVPLVDQFIGIVAASTIVAYALYTFTARESSTLMVTIPFVIFGLLRYVLLLHSEEAGEEPDRVLVTDRPILVTVVAWAVTCAAVQLIDY
jgi:4-hydroxybenzoate polyprenyltransferase